MLSFLYIVLAALGLGFLIFIHELGHYLVARRVGMRVEVFSIGFGKPLYKWDWDGVTWQICWLPFGGYVRMAGMEKEGEKEPHEIKDGFWGRSPLDRIKVALAGPAVNLAFALLAFAAIWLAGGREKNFFEFTRHVGWVDPNSELFAKGVRPGDQIQSYDGNPVSGVKAHLYAAMFSDGDVEVRGLHREVATGKEEPFTVNIKPYQHPDVIEEGIRTTGVLGSASYLIYDEVPDASNEKLMEGSPMKDSGLEYGDRIIWVDGVEVHSLRHLSHVLNDHRILLTVKRGDETFLARVPRVAVSELRLDELSREELTDWQYAAGFRDARVGQLHYIPYNLDANSTVEGRLGFVDTEQEERYFPEHVMSETDRALKVGDKILAVDGTPVSYSYQTFARLQERKVFVIVERGDELSKVVPWDEADRQYDQVLQDQHLRSLIRSIGSGATLANAGNLHLLRPVTPVTRADLMNYGKADKEILAQRLKQEKAIEEIRDPDQRAAAYRMLREQENQLMLGIVGVKDRRVLYNPLPSEQFNQVFKETWQTLSALVGGYMNPKFASGPIGIVQVIQQQWRVGIKEVLFWLAVISLNLGVLNLLPLPVLDGGYVVLSTFEIVTGKRLKAKTVERLIIPFAILLISLFVFLTYHDLARIFGRLLG